MIAKLQSNKKLYTYGFTLIEVLVTITIIGAVASVVVASVNGARERALNSNVTSSLTAARNEAEIVFLEDASYANMCESTRVAGAVVNNTSLYECYDSPNEWARQTRMPDGSTYHCIDSTGIVVTSEESRIADGDYDCSTPTSGGGGGEGEGGSDDGGIAAVLNSMTFGGGSLPVWDASGNSNGASGALFLRDSSNNNLAAFSLDDSITNIQTLMSAALDAGSVTVTWDFNNTRLTLDFGATTPTISGTDVSRIFEEATGSTVDL